MLAAIGTGWDADRHPTWGCAVYLAVTSTSTLLLDGHQLNFGFEVMSPESADEPAAFAALMDERMVACRRRAKTLAGHNLVPDLDRLDHCATARRLRGVDGVRQQWTNRTVKGRGMASMVDTAHDIALPGDLRPASLAAACEHANLQLVLVADPPDLAPASTVRNALACTLAVALIAARSTGRYTWTSTLDVDHLVTDAAWDLLAELDQTRLGQTPTR